VAAFSPAPPPLLLILLLLGAFLLGAIPFGFLAGKLLKGVDLRTHGSGNIGATNTLRVLGTVPGIVVLLLDVLKGYVPVVLAHALRLDPWSVMGAGLAAILGHTFSPFLGFRGGKGVATSLGVLAGLSPVVAGGVLLVFALVVGATRYVSLGSILAAAAQAAFFWMLPHPLPYRLFGLLIAVFVIAKHRPNIERLRKGEESRFVRKRSP
jgi:glycerol-3-phosphate acyltransferase PlsY